MATSPPQRSLSYGPGDYDYQETKVLKRRPVRSSSVLASTVWSLIYSKSSAEQEEKKQDQEQAWTQALYNAAALVLVFITACMFVAVYYVMEPFLYPLLWAALAGMVLHPFKHNCTTKINEWLTELETNHIPLSLGLILSPLFFFRWLSQYCEYLLVAHWKLMLYSSTGIASLWLMYALNMPLRVYNGVVIFSSVFDMIDTVMDHTILQLCTVTVGFVVLLVLSRHSEYATAVKILSICLWFIATLNVATFVLGSVAVPVVVMFFVAGGVLSVFWQHKAAFNGAKKGLKESAKKQWRRAEESLVEKGITRKTAESVSSDNVDTSIDLERSATPTSERSSDSGSRKQEDTASTGEDGAGIKQTDSSEEKQVSFGPVTAISPAPQTTWKSEQKTQTPHSGSRDESDGRLGRAVSMSTAQGPGPQKESMHSHTQSNQVFLILFVACLVVILWRYTVITLPLVGFVVLLLLWSGLKKVVSLAAVQNSVLCKLPNLLSSAQNWVSVRRNVLFPSPMPTLLRMYFIVDKRVLKAVQQSVGSLVSAFIIVGLLLTVLATSIVLIFEIQVEVTHYLSVAATVWNRTVASNPQLSEWMGKGEGGDSFETTLGAFADQGYVYSREWLASQIHSVVSDSDGKNTSIVEQRVLDLFDKLYQSYVLKNTSAFDFQPVLSPTSNDTHEDTKMWNELNTIVVENLETILAVLKSLWSIVSENLPVAFSLLYALLELLLSGGTTLLNLVVFITVLFYLLWYSKEDYLPVKWVIDLLPNLTQSEEDYGSSFSRAIRSVFHASIRRALFYGLYTWLVHTIFGLPMSLLPSVLAAIAGIIPFVGPYWVAVPAMLWLWLMEGEPVLAMAMLALSLLPPFFVDYIIYGEIEGGHPYLTGLSIAGGMYFAGLQGALIGPILLCCLLFVVDFYGDMLN